MIEKPEIPRPGEEGTEGGPATEPPEHAPDPEEEHEVIERPGEDEDDGAI